MVAAVEAPPCIVAVKRRWPLRRVFWLAAVLALLPLAIEAFRVMLGSNFHTVVPGRIYRFAQPTADSLEQLIAAHGVQTIINLRGPCEQFDWYLSEARTAHKHNICLEDISFSAGRLPPVPEVRRLVEVLDRTAYPIVLHCRRGADRTGLAAAMALLLTTETSLEDACGQLALRFGHVAFGRTGQLNHFLDFYVDWLKAEDRCHSNENFRHWVLHCYCPGSCLSDLAFATPRPTTVSVADSPTFHLRVRNAALLPWVFKPEWLAGVHLGCHVYDDQDQLLEVAKAGLRDARVLPGESINLTLVIAPLRKPGRYRLQIDMVDEQQCWFYQTGSQPLEVELMVRE